MSATPGSGLRLEIVAGKATGFTVTVADRLVVGRQSEGPGNLGEDPELSRHHAQISLQSSGEYAIQDLASTNGTFVNGMRLVAPAVLSSGDAIELGGTTLVVRVAPGAAAPAPAPVDVRAPTVSAEPSVPRLDLRLVVDLDRGEAEVGVGDGGERVGLSLQREGWQIRNEG